MDSVGIWHISTQGPSRLPAEAIDIERDLEDWIENDPALLEQGLVIVGRQIRLEGGPLDLLALDPQGRWVLIEIKRDRLRREVIAQAIDYVSCLDQLDPAWLRERCDAYLLSHGASATLDQLLEDRGRTLESEPDGREIIIYLVGTAIDPHLERMVGYLGERGDLAIRMVTFSAFSGPGGAKLLARGIHEGTAQPPARSSRPSPTGQEVEAVLALADTNGVGGVLRTLYAAANEVGLVARPYAKSIMFAPPANRTRCLFVVWVERRSKEPGAAKAYIAAEAFEQFYGTPATELKAALGGSGYVIIDQTGAERVSTGLRQLLNDGVGK